MPVSLHRRCRCAARLGVLALLLPLLSPVGFAWPADGDQPAKKEKAAKPPQENKPKGEATRASGAAIVAKSKACVGDTPKIEKVKPDEGKPGDKVIITGKNFGAAGCLSVVSFGPGSPAKFVHRDESTVTATVPTAKKGLRLLTITTASGQDSKPFLVK